MASEAQNQPTKLCFVTVGATASFLHLLLSVLNSKFLEALSQSGYTHLLVQYGKDGQIIYENFLIKYPAGSPELHGIEIGGFEFNQAGLGEEMRMTKEDKSEGRSSGMIISHAGMSIVTLSSIRSKLTLDSRVRKYPRGTTTECPSCSCPESYSQRQPSVRIGQRIAETGLCRGQPS